MPVKSGPILYQPSEAVHVDRRQVIGGVVPPAVGRRSPPQGVGAVSVAGGAVTDRLSTPGCPCGRTAPPSGPIMCTWRGPHARRKADRAPLARCSRSTLNDANVLVRAEGVGFEPTMGVTP
jgi:hypothetical protein